MSLTTGRDSGIVIAVTSNLAHANTSSLARLVGRARMERILRGVAFGQNPLGLGRHEEFDERLPCVRYHRVVLVHQTDIDTTVGNAVFHIGIACGNDHTVFLQLSQKIVRSAVAPFHEQRRRVERHRPEVGICHRKPALPARVGQVEY